MLQEAILDPDFSCSEVILFPFISPSLSSVLNLSISPNHSPCLLYLLQVQWCGTKPLPAHMYLF